MKTLLLPVLILALSLAGCAAQPATPPTKTQTSTTGSTKTGAKKPAPITQLIIYQIILEGQTTKMFGTNNPKIGCNDRLVAVAAPTATLTDDTKFAGTWKALIAYDMATQGLHNPWKSKTDIQFENYKIDGKILTVNLKGNLTIDGACELPRLEETIKSSYRSLGYENVKILINGKDIHSFAQ